MQYAEFLARVRTRAGLDSNERAADVVRAVLRALGQRLQGDTAADVAMQLPPELAGDLTRPADVTGQRFDVNEFLGRIAQHAHLDLDTTRRAARAVIETLMEAVSPDAMRHIWTDLPREYLDLFEGAAPHPGPESGMPGGGQGRRDDVGRTGVYPVSATSTERPAPDAPVRAPMSWGQGERGAAGYEDAGGSELVWRDGQLLGGLTTGPSGAPTINIHGLDNPEPTPPPPPTPDDITEAESDQRSPS